MKFFYGEDDKKIALDNINLSINEGEFLAIIGTNGSGKSTLAKHFNALLLPAEGKVTVCGIDTKSDADLWEIRKNVGMVFQNPDNEIVAAIVEDDIAFGPENLGIPTKEIRTRVDLALETVNLKDFRKFSPSKLSGGQKQRLAIAGVIAMRTKILVLDEPTAMLDPQGRREILETAKKLHSSGMTIIYITHFMEEAAVADRVAVMEKGKILKIGTPRKIFSDVEEMHRLGLEVPAAAEIAERLRKKGLKLSRDILTGYDLAKELKNL